MNQDDLITAVARSEVLLCPSYLEGFGLAPLEAMAAGTLVIAGDSEGIRSLIRNGDTGILLPLDNPDAWIKTTSNALLDSNVRKKMEESAIKEVKIRFDWQSANKELQDCLKSLYFSR